MIWFRTDTGITRHRDFVSLRLALGLGRHAVAGHLLCLFEAVAEHHETGNLAGVADIVIEEWAEWRGEAGAFVTAMRDSGWLTATNELHGWYKRHASMLSARVKKKEERDESRAASRKAKAEARKSASKVSKDGPRPSKTNLDEFGPSDPTGPDRTGPDDDVHTHVVRSGPVRPLLPTPTHTPTTGDLIDTTPTPKPNRAEQAGEALAWWNELSARLLGLTPARALEGGAGKRRGPRLKAAAGQILANTAALEAELAKPFYRGGGSGRWCASLDYLIQPGKLDELLERAHAPKPPSPDDLAVEQAVAEYEREQFAAKESA